MQPRNIGEPETLIERFGSGWLTNKPMDNRFDPVKLYSKSRAYVVREVEGAHGLAVFHWDVTAGAARWPMTNVRNLALPQWRNLASDPARRCLIPLTEFCEWTPKPVDRGDGKKPLKGEMWFNVLDQNVFAVAGLWREIDGQRYFAMVTCEPNDLVAPIHPKAVITILHPDDYKRW